MNLFKFNAIVLAGIFICLVSCKKTEGNDTPSEPDGEVSIEGKNYKTVKIGNQVWTAENYAGPGGATYGPNAKSDYGKYYYYTEVKAIKLPAGWHLPTMEDYRDLGQSCGVQFVAGAQNTEAAKKLISKSGWSNATGTNLSGFNALPGNMIYNGEPGLDGDVAEFWTATGNTFSIMEAGQNGSLLNVQFFGNSNQPEYRFPVRFVKNK